MLIDFILDRRADRRKGIMNYEPKTLKEYLDLTCFGSYDRISRIMDVGDEDDVKNALCDYLNNEPYPEDIKEFVKSVDWLKSDKKKEIFQTIRAYKSKEDMYKGNALDMLFIVNMNPENRDRYEKEYALGVAWGLTVKYAKPCVVVLTTEGGDTKVTEVHVVRRPQL